MILTLLYLFHEYVAKSFIPYYKLRNESFEAANRLIESWEKEFTKKRRKKRKEKRLYDGESDRSSKEDLKRLLF